MKRIKTLSEIDVNRLTAAVIVPTFADVYLGLLQNCSPFEDIVDARHRREGNIN